jgi:hypothetical protein
MCNQYVMDFQQALTLALTIPEVLRAARLVQTQRGLLTGEEGRDA